MKTIYFKKVNEKAVIPTYAHPGDAGMDLYSVEDVTIAAGAFGLVRTGLCMELAPKTEAQIRSRSGLALKNGVFVLNSPGTIDEGYRGELGVILANLGKSDFQVHTGDRIAQMVIADLCICTPVEKKEDLSDTARGKGGFGSSGVN